MEGLVFLGTGRLGFSGLETIAVMEGVVQFGALSLGTAINEPEFVGLGIYRPSHLFRLIDEKLVPAAPFLKGSYIRV